MPPPPPLALVLILSSQTRGGVFGVDPLVTSSDAQYRWQWCRVKTYEAARQCLIEAISGNKMAGARLRGGNF